MTSYNDLKRAGKEIINRIESDMEKRSNERAQQLAAKFSKTRGVWVLFHIPAFAMLSASSFGFAYDKLHIPELFAFFLGMAIAISWWSADFTKNHPFISFLLAGFFLPFFFMYGIDLFKR